MQETVNYANQDATTPREELTELAELILPTNPPARKLGVALVGLGNYSTSQLAPALQQTKFCELKGVVTGSPSKIPEWKNKYSIPDSHIYSYENFEEIGNNPDIDIAYIVLPNALHAEYVIRAAAAGKHVICEKPMAISIKECDRMIEACRNAGKLLSIGYRLHYDPHHIEVMRISREKVFGKITYMHAQHALSKVSGWRLDKKLAGGGPLMDLGIYCLQAACYVSNEEPVSVRVTEMAAMPGHDIEQSLSWEMTFGGGLIAKCETSYKYDMNLLHAQAEHGWVQLSPAFSYKYLIGKTATGFLKIPSLNQQALQMDDFARSILENRPVKLPGEMGRTDLRVITAIYESMEKKERVKIKA
ncbi:MAG: Gfo/Idh/MocA family oxidoreductase [Bacteroidetes bacterium]|jgi:predicted dehydrogenase|nr:MAG: Gfo/Idh/MocA family oxidoreductase [Bacteroidota bacterium]